MTRSERSAIELIDELGYAEKSVLLPLYAEALDVEYIDLADYDLQNLPGLLNEKISRKFGIIALSSDGCTLTLGMKDPKDIFAIDSAQMMTSLLINPVLVDEELLRNVLDELFPPQKIVEVTVTQNNVSEDNDENVRSIFREKIGTMLLDSGEISKQQLDSALEIQKSSGGMIGSILINEGYISKEPLYKLLEKQVGVPYVDVSQYEVTEEAINLVPRKIAFKYHVLPLQHENNTLTVAMADPLNMFAIDDLRLATGCDISAKLADNEQINIKLLDYYPQVEPEPVVETKVEPTINFEQEMAKVKEEIEVEVQDRDTFDANVNFNDLDNAPIVRMLNMIFKNAIEKGASDIHIEAYEDCVMVRFRIDGQLAEVIKHDKKLLPILVARVKIISGLDIAEKRLPQDGRITLKINNKNYDFRVSILPTVFGEKVVIRIADKEGFGKAKTELGFSNEDLIKFNKILEHPHGIVLVTGPTGSGKSTTLYAALREFCKPTVNILTVEDPVECTIRGINQVQVNTKTGMTFATALRAFLRQDPDIIMVGEIRDSETAEIAIRSAITGHLVLSTLHTNDSVSSISRLIDMGVEPFLISSSLVGVVAQRLVRRLCPSCKEGYIPTANQAKILKLEDQTTIYKPVGCPQCNGTGYKGRIAAYEILNITEDMKVQISMGASTTKMKETALKNGMHTLKDSCAQLVLSGITSLEEMLSVVSMVD